MIDVNEMLLYTTKAGDIKVNVFYNNQTIWLTQAKIAHLFGVTLQVIAQNFKDLFDSNELIEAEVTSTFEAASKDSSSYTVKLYNLEAIINIGYRINSKQASDFRAWATKTLKEFIVKGFVLDSKRLKNGPQFGEDYFNELLEKIREIRASERRFYQKITDIYAECSADYNPNNDITKQFYAQVQNKLHFAIHGFTAAEVIHARANYKKQFMGLSNWKNAPTGKILKSDVSVAKNYLTEDELKALNRIVTMYLDYAELQASRKVLMKMKDWALKLDAFLEFNELNILKHAGKISADMAKAFSESEYDRYRVIQDQLHQSDFDKLCEETSKLEKLNE